MEQIKVVENAELALLFTYKTVINWESSPTILCVLGIRVSSAIVYTLICFIFLYRGRKIMFTKLWNN